MTNVFGDEEDHQILRPNIIRVGHVQFIDNGFGSKNDQYKEDYDEPHPEYKDEYEDEPNCDIEDDGEYLVNDRGEFEFQKNVPNMMFGTLIGFKGQTKERIEKNTKCKIIIPPRNSDSDIVKIVGRSKTDIERANIQIDLSLQGKRFQRPATHFLSFKISSPEISSRYMELKSQLTNEFGLNEKLFENENKLHLTIGVLHLLSKAEIEKAKTILGNLYEIINSILSDHEVSKVELPVEGLEIMNDDPYMTDVMYAKVSDENSLLQEISDEVLKAFISGGLAEEQYNRVKIHCTIMNSKFVAGDVNPKDERNRKVDRQVNCFDSSNIMKKYGKFKFGNVVIDTVYLHERFKPSTDGYFNTVKTLSL